MRKYQRRRKGLDRVEEKEVREAFLVWDSA